MKAAKQFDDLAPQNKIVLKNCVFIWKTLWLLFRKDIDLTSYCPSMSVYAFYKYPYGAQICRLVTKSENR